MKVKSTAEFVKHTQERNNQLGKIQPVQMGIFTQFEDSDERAKCYKYKKTLKSFWV